mgnify:CR=1 FL=1
MPQGTVGPAREDVEQRLGVEDGTVRPRGDCEGGARRALEQEALRRLPRVRSGSTASSRAAAPSGGEGGESPYDFLVAGKTTPLSALNPLDDLAAAASAFRTGPGKGTRNRADESFGSSAPLHSTSKRAAVMVASTAVPVMRKDAPTQSIAGQN